MSSTANHSTDTNAKSTVLHPQAVIAISAGAGAIVIFIIAVSCICYYRMGCCKSTNTGSSADDLEAKDIANDIPQHQEGDTKQGIENETVPEQNGHNRPSSKENNAEIENEKSTEVSANNGNVYSLDSTEMPKENGALPVEGSEKKESDSQEDRISVIYAKPDKRSIKENAATKNDSMPNTENGEMDTNVKDPQSCPDSNKESESVETPEKPKENYETMPDDLYAKPNKNSSSVDKDAIESSSQGLELENRLSFGDDYATIHEPPSFATRAPSNEIPSEAAPAYEDVRLGEIAPPVRDQPPRLPSDSLIRPPRHPSSENTQNVEQPYAESSVLGTPMPETPDDVFISAEGKSASVRQPASPYAQTQLVPRSQSARYRSHSDNEKEEEPIVELGRPGIQKPSIKMPGSPPALLDIPDEEDNPDYEKVDKFQYASEESQQVQEEPIVELGSPVVQKPSIKTPGSPPALLDIQDEEDSPDYERVDKFQNVSEESQPVTEMSKHQENKTEDEDSGWVENLIYSSVDDPTRDSTLEEEESPQLVTYEQTNFLRVNQNTSDMIEEDADYEEIRRSRLAEFRGTPLSDQTTTQTIDGQVVPVTEL